MNDSCQNIPRWARWTLLAAAAYNLLWGALVVAQPGLLFRWAGMEAPRYPQIWQCVGMIVGVYGVGYAVAARDPYRHWVIVLVGLLGKLFGPLGFLGAALQGDLPWRFGLTILTNDLLWWAPFTAILYGAWKHHSDLAAAGCVSTLEQALDAHHSHRGATLRELSRRRPLLLVFARHSGCTFCREMLSDLGEQRARLEARGVELAVVHMGTPLEGTQLAIRYGLEGVHLFDDPDCELYEAFGLQRGSLPQLFGPKVWWRGLWAGVIEGHGVGPVRGDAFRLQGAFVLQDGEILVAGRTQTAADTIDFVSLCQSARTIGATDQVPAVG